MRLELLSGRAPDTRDGGYTHASDLPAAGASNDASMPGF